MRSEPSTASSPERRLSEAIREAGVGEAELYVGLADLGGLGEVAVDGNRATVTVTLPVPAADVRAAIADEIRAVARRVDGITDADVDWSPDVAGSGARVEAIPRVKNVLAVSSGKGGVGKSTVAVNLAAALADAGAAVGLLDADVYGPNAPTMLGLTDATPKTTMDDRIVPRDAHGVRVMSMDFVTDEDDPVIWRGPMVDDVLNQLTTDVAWGDLDYLVVDLPPGTGDAQLTLVQYLPVTGAVVVTTPQPVAVDDARRGLRQFARYDVPILGVVENMSRFECPDCGDSHEIFGEGGGDELRDEFDVPVLGRVPIDPAVGAADDDEDEEPSSRGVKLPLVGRLAFPQSQQDDAESATVPALGPDADDETRTSLRGLATRVAARTAHLNSRSFDGEVSDSPATDGDALDSQSPDSDA